ncbi:hypothetical protein L9F63_021402, partial [Diploptera punctata]
NLMHTSTYRSINTLYAVTGVKLFATIQQLTSVILIVEEAAYKVQNLLILVSDLTTHVFSVSVQFWVLHGPQMLLHFIYFAIVRNFSFEENS